ncbi:hypothetical protein Scep_001470 [Stephania cephalantha]|uniref:Pentatricopeptide repeat-containing protein n=1 Tax=Stephania cephalantha TaxID=152367 RepID=A0AAP0LBT9_9MAGN
MCARRNGLVSAGLVSAVVSTLREKRSKSRWNDVKTICGPTGLTPQQVSEITLQLRNNPHLALRFFYWSDRTSLCTHDLISYSTIIHVLARSRRFKTITQTLITTAIRVSELDDALDGPDHPAPRPPKIFQTLVKTYSRCDSAPFVFDLLIRACLKSHNNNLDRSIAIVRLLRSRNIWPSIGTCNLLIRAVSRFRGANAALDMYRELFDVRVKPNAQTFNILMLGFYQHGIMDRVEEIWTEMVKVSDCSDWCPNVFSYCVLLAAFCDRGMMNRAVGVWEEMRIKDVKPDVMVYNTLISGFCKSLDLEKAEEVFRQMGLSDVQATPMTYEHMINGYCKIGDVDSAILLYKDMRRRKFRPDASTVDLVVGELCNKSRVLEALEMFRDVMKSEVFNPGRLTFEFLIKGLCEDGKIEEALKLQTEMVGKGFEPDSEIYKAFIMAYNKCGDKEKARKLTEEMFTIGSEVGEA